jgi:hypothetical protein
MSRSPRLENKIRLDIQLWLDTQGADFSLSIKEFCQGNRASLTQVMNMVKQLGKLVFVSEGEALSDDLLERLEYGIFDLIGKFSSTPGGEALTKAIDDNLGDYLTEIFSEAKKEWNLNHYKITASYEELDPNNCMIPALDQSVDERDVLDFAIDPKKSRRQAKLFLDELVVFTKTKLRGEKNRKIAINWLENPDKHRDYGWLATLTNSSTGSIKVTLTRLKQTLAENYNLRHVGDSLTLDKVNALTKVKAKQRLNHGYL